MTGTNEKNEELPPKVIAIMLATTMLTFATLVLSYRLLF